MPTIQTSGRALGWFSLGLGAAQVLAPHAVQRLAGVRGGGPSDGLVRFVGARELAAGVGVLSQRKPAVWLWSRVAGDAMDLLLLGVAITDSHNRRGRVALALAAVGGVTLADVLAAQATRTGGDSADDSGEAEGDDSLHLSKAITVRRPPQEVYAFWRDFRNFPNFMSHLESVAVLDERRSHWTARGPAARLVEWDAEITEDQPGQVLAWRSLEGADVQNSGRVRFVPAPGERGTEVHVEIEYAPPGGGLGSTVARLFGQEPHQQVQADLRKFKQVMETGEVIRSAATLGGTQLFQRAAQPPASGQQQQQQTSGAHA